MSRWLAAVVVLALIVAGCSPSGKKKPATSSSPSSALAWSPCRKTFECAKLKVPLDYADPARGTIDISVVRLKATGPGDRIGSLILNFGGPGGSGVDTLAQSAGDYKNLGTRYDLVSFDPRGVGESAPVTCADDQRTDELNAENPPRTPAEITRFVAEGKTYVKGCEQRSGKLLPYVGTLSAAKDMDRLRAALGDAKTHYLGISYGTWLGGNYAHQFPSEVGRAVLDGAVDTKISTENQDLQQAAAFQRALRNYAAKEGDTTEAVGKFLDGLRVKPLPTRSGRQLTQGLGTTGVVTALYAEQYWPILKSGLAQARQGDGTVLLALADAQNGRDQNGHYNNLSPANTAIRCADTTERLTVADVRKALPKFRNASPVFGSSLAWGLTQCTGWPVKGNNAAKDVSAPKAAPIVVVGNTGDPATPYAWAPALAKELGSGVLLTLHGQGHSAYGTGNACIHKNVDAYLLNGTVPPTGTSCS